MTKEEKQVEAALDSIISQVNEIRQSISTLIFKLENEYMTFNWLNVVDNFALLSGQISMLNRLLKSEKSMPILRNFAVFPLHLSPDPDPELAKITEGRLSVFNHEIPPLYLRTRLETEVEEQIKRLSEKFIKAPSLDTLQKHTNQFNKAATHAFDQLRNFKDNLDSDVQKQKHSMPQLSSPSDTQSLLAAITHGKGLKPSGSAPSSAATSLPQPPAADQRLPSGPSQGQLMNKSMSSIRTNIRSANVHPYQR